MIRFSVVCQNDGPVEVALTDLSAIVFDGEEEVDLLFMCPSCGEEIRVCMRIPNLFVSALELSEMLSDATEALDSLAEERERGRRPRELTDSDRKRIEGYCEYFRRQLAEVDTVDALLAEIDSR